MRADQKSRGAALLITSSFFFALMSVFVRLAGELPFFQKALFRNLVAAFVSAALLLRHRTSLRVPAPCRLPLLGRTLFGMAAVFCNYYAIDHLPLASSNSLNKLAPFFAILFAALFLKERVERGQLACLLVALTGSLFLIVPNLESMGFASCVALLGGGVSGASHTALRAIRLRGDMDSSAVVFCFCTFSLLVTLIPCLLYWTPMSARQTVLMLLAGSSCAVAQYALTGAYRCASPRDISIYDSTQIIFSAIMGYLFFRQIPTAASLTAYFLIILASALLFLHHRRTAAAAA